MHFIEFTQAVFTDRNLTIEATGPFEVPSTSELPKNIFFSSREYNGTGSQKLSDGTKGTKLWDVRFTIPDHRSNVRADREVSIRTGAVYDE